MFVCNGCGEEFEVEDDLGIHLSSDFGEELANDKCKCTLCDKEYDDWGDLYMHLIYTEKLGRISGTDKKEYEEWMQNPEFDDIRAAIDNQ